MTARQLAWQTGTGAHARRSTMACRETRAAHGVTVVAVISARGIFPKHGRGKFSRANATWEKSMTFAKQLSDHRSRSPIQLLGQIDDRPAENPHAGRGQTVILSWPVEEAPRRNIPAPLTRLVVSAAAGFSHCAGSAFPNFLSVIVSWAIAEMLAGCAAYAQAMYPALLPLEAAEPQPAEAMARGRSGATAHLSLVSSNTTDGIRRREPLLPRGPSPAAGEPAQRPNTLPAVSLPAVSSPAATHQRWPVSLGLFVAAAGARLRLAFERRRAIAELRDLDARSLRDIGISYSDIKYVVRHGKRE